MERNPVRAGMIEKAEGYKYSSAAAHLLGRNNEILTEALFEEKERSQYIMFMNDLEDRDGIREIRWQTRLGRPLGGAEFIDKISGHLGRDLIFRPKGRPKKND